MICIPNSVRPFLRVGLYLLIAIQSHSQSDHSKKKKQYGIVNSVNYGNHCDKNRVLPLISIWSH